MLPIEKFTYFLNNIPSIPSWFSDYYIERTKPKEPIRPHINDNDSYLKNQLDLYDEGMIDNLPESLSAYDKQFKEYIKQGDIYYDNFHWKMQILWSWLYAKTMVDLSTMENIIQLDSKTMFDNFIKRLEEIIPNE
jgi:hypothetical protein